MVIVPLISVLQCVTFLKTRNIGCFKVNEDNIIQLFIKKISVTTFENFSGNTQVCKLPEYQHLTRTVLGAVVQS